MWCPGFHGFSVLVCELHSKEPRDEAFVFSFGNAGVKALRPCPPVSSLSAPVWPGNTLRCARHGCTTTTTRSFAGNGMISVKPVLTKANVLSVSQHYFADMRPRNFKLALTTNLFFCWYSIAFQCRLCNQIGSVKMSAGLERKFISIVVR